MTTETVCRECGAPIVRKPEQPIFPSIALVVAGPEVDRPPCTCAERQAAAS